MGIANGADTGSAIRVRELTFSKLVANMLPRDANPRLISNIARRCCSCGGLPPGCNCHNDVLETTAWDKWPGQVLEFLAQFVTKLIRRLKIQLKLREKRLATT